MRVTSDRVLGLASFWQTSSSAGRVARSSIRSMAGLRTDFHGVHLFGGQGRAAQSLAQLAREWAPHKVRVNVLVPGFFPAEQNRSAHAGSISSIMGNTPMKRSRGARAHRGHAAAGEHGSGIFITGEELIVDGASSRWTSSGLPANHTKSHEGKSSEPIRRTLA